MVMPGQVMFGVPLSSTHIAALRLSVQQWQLAMTASVIMLQVVLMPCPEAAWLSSEQQLLCVIATLTAEPQPVM